MRKLLILSAVCIENLLSGIITRTDVIPLLFLLIMTSRVGSAPIFIMESMVSFISWVLEVKSSSMGMALNSSCSFLYSWLPGTAPSCWTIWLNFCLKSGTSQPLVLTAFLVHNPGQILQPEKEPFSWISLQAIKSTFPVL